jgi:chromosome segregation ATPase
MPTAKAGSGNRKGFSPAAAKQIRQLQATVRQLRLKLAQEAKRSKANLLMVAEARRARDRVAKEITSLKNQGRKLAQQVKRILSDAQSRERARKEAMTRVAELRTELKRKTDELMRKSGELAKLAKESSERARAIIHSEAAASHDNPPASTIQPHQESTEPPPPSGMPRDTHIPDDTPHT